MRVEQADVTGQFYANITVADATAADVVPLLREWLRVAYVAGHRGGVVVFHEDFDTQEQFARDLSARLQRPTLLAMVFGGTILLYHLYVNGEQVDAYVSSPHDGLELDGPAPEGNVELLCETFGMEHHLASVRRILTRPAKPDTDYAYAVNRHGELLRALNLPLISAGTGFAAIDAGELPHAPGFDPSTLVRTGG